MSSTGKHNFSTPQRFGVWIAHGSRCFWCERPIEFLQSTVDHVLPESLLQHPERLASLREIYALGETFQINGYENWVPCHSTCNSRKNVYLEPTPSPAMVEIFRRLRAKALLARSIAEHHEKDQTQGKIFARILSAIEKGTVTTDDIKELLAGLPITEPVTIADWEAVPTENFSTDQAGPQSLDIHKAPTFPGWTRVAFDEQDGIEAALLGQSMGPRHVVACPQVPEVRDVVNSLERLGAVAVTGDSGSGKSMLVWHAAHELHKCGWEVYLLTNPRAATGELPHASPRALLVIDDAQSLADVPARPAAVSNRRAIVVVSTSRIPGFRIEVRLSGKRCVEAIAASLRQQESELLPVLSRLNPHLGPRAMDGRLGFHIDDAMRRSEFPWQFMFNLGGGHLRLEGKLAAVAASPPLDAILYAISAYQLATLDTPCPVQWLLSPDAIGIRETEDLLAYVRTLQGHIELVRTLRGVATPHPRVAGAIISKLFYGTETGAQRRRDLLWEVLRDVTFPLRGVHWLLGELPDDLRVWFGLTDDLSTLLVDRCYASEDIGGASLVLSHLLSYRQPQSNAAMRSLAEKSNTIVQWIETCNAEHASGVASLVNSIINRDRVNKNVYANTFINSTDPVIIADRIQRTTPADGYAQAGLIGRLTFGSKDWKARVVGALDRGRLIEDFGAWPARELGAASEFLMAIAAFDDSLALDLAVAIVPAIVAAIRESPRDAIISAQHMLWYVFHFGPDLLGLPQPDERRVSIMSNILREVGSVHLAKAYQEASRRDWHELHSLSALVRDVAPDLAKEISKLLDVGPLLPTFTLMDAYEIEDVLIALALGDGWEPAATVARTVCAQTGRMSWRAAALAPEAAAQVVGAGGAVILTLSGGLPGWTESAAALAKVYEKNPEAARAILRAYVVELADGFLYRQANGGAGALMFLEVASTVDDESVVAAMRALDLAPARAFWSDCAHGKEEERSVLRAFIAIAERTGGDAAQLAAEARGWLANADKSVNTNDVVKFDDKQSIP